VISLSLDGCRHAEKTLAFISQDARCEQSMDCWWIHPQDRVYKKSTSSYLTGCTDCHGFESTLWDERFSPENLGWEVLKGSWVIYNSSDKYQQGGCVQGWLVPLGHSGLCNPCRVLQERIFTVSMGRGCREAEEWGKRSLGASPLSSTLPQLISPFSFGSQLCHLPAGVKPLLSPLLSLPCFVGKNLCSEVPEQLSLCLRMATCRIDICRCVNCACKWMQMVRDVRGWEHALKQQGSSPCPLL